MRPILLVEDSPEDLEAMQRAFERAAVGRPVSCCLDGDEALEYLHRRGRYAEREAGPPALILLDLNLPGTDGHEVLAEIRGDPGLRHIPVIVLSTSASAREIRECYAGGANTYIQKPADSRGLVEAITRIRDYWFDTATLPNDE